MGDTHEDRNSPDHEEMPIHIEGVDLLYQVRYITREIGYCVASLVV
jgi:hypothetical protein